MRKIAAVIVIIGTILFLLGFVPYFIAYPMNDSPNSGPANFSELMIMLTYEGWFVQIGLVLLLVSGLMLYKLRKKG